MKKSFVNLLLLIFTLAGLSCSEANAIKIGLLTRVNSVNTGTSNQGAIYDELTGKSFCKLEPMTAYKLTPGRNCIHITLKGKKYDIKSDRIVIKTSSSGFISAKNKWYRGNLIVRNVNGKLTVINDIKLEEYLLGVVPSEMPSTWHEEALKAQAVAARSYAVANLGKQSRHGYDLKDNTEDQAYGGASAETERARNAVAQTAGIVITQNKNVIPAFYFASAGGKTSNAGDVWAHDLPFIQSVPSFDEGIRKMGHGIGMSQYGCNNLAKMGYNAFQILAYYYKNVKFGRLKSDI